LARLLARNPAYPKKVLLTRPDAAQVERNFLALFNKDNIRATVLASIPWFLQDLGTYGIGIFTPTILAASIGHKTTHVRSLADLINNDVLAAKGAGLIDLLLIVGIVCAILLVNKIGSIRLQIWGVYRLRRGAGDRRLFRLRHRRTKVLPDLRGLHGVQFHDQPWAELSNLPYCRRGVSDGMGAGFAAAFAKVGAVATAFLFPILLADIGTQALLYILVGASFLGAIITWLFRVDTTGVSLEQI
jgi:MFS transporter, putative metabolite transport protein